jgi:hypothetical protein
VTIRQNDPGLSADLLKEIARADHRCLDRWTAEMRRNGRVVLRTNLFKTIVWGLVCWLFVGASIVMFTVNAGSWNPLSEDFGGWLVFFFLLVFAAGFVLFGLGAVLWTFIFPIVRPHLVVSRWGVEASWWKPGGRTIRFAAPWTGIVSLGGQFLPRRWPMPDGLIVTITAHGTTADQNRSMGRKPAMVTHRVSNMLHGRSRDVLAFLVQVRGAPPGQS